MTMMMPHSNQEAQKACSDGGCFEVICQNGTFVPHDNRASEAVTVEIPIEQPNVTSARIRVLEKCSREAAMDITSQILESQNQSLIPAHPGDTWTQDEVRDELRRILRSRFFIKSTRLSCFLATAVDYLLTGQADRFKEYTVGTQVYGRPATYDPTQDTIVRTEARRLRSKLKEYYFSCVDRHRLRITLVSGSYVPVIELSDSSRYGHACASAHSVMPSDDEASLSLAVFSFLANTAESGNQHIAGVLEEDLTHELAQKGDIKVFRTCFDGHATADQLSDWSRSGVRFALRGYVRQSDDGPIAQIQLTTIRGLIVWSGRFCGKPLQSQSSEIASAVYRAFLCSARMRISDRCDIPPLLIESVTAAL
jgi:TolB-like protein